MTDYLRNALTIRRLVAVLAALTTVQTFLTWRTARNVKRLTPER